MSPSAKNLLVVATVALVAVVAMNTVSPAIAEYVPGYSFEAPDVSEPPFFAESVSDWNIEGRAGVVLNGAYNTLSNVDGTQMGFIDEGANSGTLYQTLSASYEVGKSYTLMAGWAKTSYAPGNAEDTVRTNLFYYDAGYHLINGRTDYQTALSQTALTDFSVAIGAVQASDPWAGKPITISFSAVRGNVGKGSVQGTYNIDNVRLNAVPEPAPIMLLATALIGLLACAWRKRRQFMAWDF